MSRNTIHFATIREDGLTCFGLLPFLQRCTTDSEVHIYDQDGRIWQITEVRITMLGGTPTLEISITDQDYDPTPWCHVCGARTKEKCKC